MHAFTTAFSALFVASSALAQSLPPSPTASVGCEPHGDHWHCDAPASVTSAASTASGTDDHEEGSETLAPSPTESIGCESHGDHWHCDGPVSTTSSPASTTSTNDDEEDEHDDEDHSEGSGGSLAPSPTESIGCVSHGDHWHCDGPAATATESANASSTDPVEAAGVGERVLNRAAIVGGLLVAVGVGI